MRIQVASNLSGRSREDMGRSVGIKERERTNKEHPIKPATPVNSGTKMQRMTGEPWQNTLRCALSSEGYEQSSVHACVQDPSFLNSRE